VKERSIFDVECPDWCSANEAGIWCNICGDLVVSSWHVDDDTTCPQSCRTCGGPDDIDAMAEYFP